MGDNVKISTFRSGNVTVHLYLKREDLVGKGVSGNKYRKIKYNSVALKEQGFNRLVTFGGAHSNHIHAASFLCKDLGIEVIGVVRGDELEGRKDLYSPTLKEAEANGMQFYFVTRSEYRKKEQASFQQHLADKFGHFYLLPEGGTNTLAIKGCEEILIQEDKSFDYICCPVGTGGTLTGLINASNDCQRLIGFSALKGDFLKAEVKQRVKKENWDIISDYHFGGYAKVNETLVKFINDFKKQTGIQLDPIYTGKMMFGIYDLMAKGYFKNNAKVLAIHTGGTQAIEGMNIRLKNKNLPILK